jgi:hypothetical protein
MALTSTQNRKENPMFGKSGKNDFVILLLVALLGLVLSAAEVSGKRSGPPSSRNFIEEFDTDGDGLVSAQEFPGPTDEFTKLDINKDGFVDKNEKPQGPPDRDMFSDSDKNGDGRLSRDEFPGPDDQFDNLDIDKNGYIDENEAPHGPPPSDRMPPGEEQ